LLVWCCFLDHCAAEELTLFASLAAPHPVERQTLLQQMLEKQNEPDDAASTGQSTDFET